LEIIEKPRVDRQKSNVSQVDSYNIYQGRCTRTQVLVLCGEGFTRQVCGLEVALVALALCGPRSAEDPTGRGRSSHHTEGNKQKIVRAALDVDHHSVSVRAAGRIGPTKRPAHRHL
jgi:hypothetical protein